MAQLHAFFAYTQSDLGVSLLSAARHSISDQSLWHQLLWLQAHPDHCHGGNHWLENLTTLALGGLQFDSLQAQAMHRRAMRLLRKEFSSQVLHDGGHEERSASYHLLMLYHLTSLCLDTFNSTPLVASGISPILTAL